MKINLPSREMRPFWLLLPFLLAALAIDALFLPLPWPFLTGGLLIVVGAVVFFASGWTAKLNREVQLERNKLKGIVLGLEDGVVVYDQELTPSFFNSAAEAIFGLKAEEVIGRRLTPQDVENERSRLLAQVMFPSLAPVVVPRSKPGEYPQVADLSFENPVLELRVTTAPIADDRGKILGFMKIIRNRTREITLLRAKTEFITVASHQLRTPITEINWALQALSQDKNLNDAAREMVKSALSSSRKLLNLVEDLLDTTRIEEGRFGYNFESLDLVPFLEKVLAEAMPQVERAGLKLYFDRPKEKIPPLFADPKKLSMVLQNLVDNAVRYNVQGGRITVKAALLPDRPYVEVSVKDTGIGIPSDEVPKVFTKFFRGSNALKFQTEGSGLGLYIARNIIRAHGGEMWAESELNRGSAFHFVLPTDPSLVPKKEIAVE
jgi:two-component system sensor histidine kinase VicK